MRLAAIDIGTNTVRLLVAETRGTTYRPLDRRHIITRLGQGVDANRRFAPAAMRRTLNAIAEFSSVCGEFEVARMTIAGTSAVRDAGNREELLEAARTLTGAPARAVSGEEEALLSFQGATGDLQADRIFVCDIGGGSTEFVMGTPAGVDHRLSVDIGSVRLTERYLRSDPPGTGEILLMEGAIDEALREIGEQMPAAGDAVLVGLGGTITTLAALNQALDRYDSEKIHHYPLERAQMGLLYRTLAGMSLKDRLGLPLLPEGRADVIVAGTSILSRIMARWGFERVVVSERDILDGLVLQMMGAESV